MNRRPSRKDLVGLAGASLFLLLSAVPAQAGLGDLLGPILNPPPTEGGGLGELVSQVVAPVTQTVEVVVAPVTGIVTETVHIATETVIVPIVDVVGETIETTINTVEETTGVLIDETTGMDNPPAETPPLVILDEIDLPETKPVFSGASTEPGDRQLLTQPVTAALPAVTAAQVVAGDPVPTAAVVRALLTSLTPSAEDRIQSASFEADPTLQTATSVDTTWLSSLNNWLGAGISGLLDVLSIPMRLLELLFRALTSSGASLLAPASLLLSLGVGGRRRLLTVA